MAQPQHLPLLELTRGDTLESLHYGSIAVADSSGRMIAWCGDPQAVAYLRSSAKPFQALPFLERGGQAAFDLTPPEVALLCASHSGTDQHVAFARQIQAKADLLENDLKCGIHPPYDEATIEAMRQRGEQPTPNRHNCSGKHTGMLAFARLEGWSIEDYLDLSHPVQKAIVRTFAEMCDLLAEEIQIGIDGCSAPNFAVPLRNAARAYANLSDPTGLPPARAEACRQIIESMTAHPEMVAGPGRFDTLLMKSTSGRIVSKAGAEGYQGIGLRPGWQGPGSSSVGIAIKIADGDLRNRARPAVALEVLRQLGALTASEMESMEGFGPRKVLSNFRQIQVGLSRPCFQLTFADQRLQE
jgi:L-asparaginase II